MKRFQQKIGFDKDENYKIVSNDYIKQEYSQMMNLKLQLIFREK